MIDYPYEQNILVVMLLHLIYNKKTEYQVLPGVVTFQIYNCIGKRDGNYEVF